MALVSLYGEKFCGRLHELHHNQGAGSGFMRASQLREFDGGTFS